MKSVLLATISVMLSLGIIEVGLRYQDSHLNIIDLDIEIKRTIYSDVFHHGDISERTPIVSTNCAGEELIILTLGDSWMADGHIQASLLKKFNQVHPDRCAKIINAAVSSFSPALISALASTAISDVDPDIVLIHIDQTDLIDDWKYKPTTFRNDDGIVVRVAPGLNTAFELVFKASLESINTSPLYILRLVEKFYITRILWKRIYTGEYDEYSYGYAEKMKPLLSNSPEMEFVEEINYFSCSIQNMIIGIVNIGIASKKIIIITHPHYLNIYEENGKKYNNIVTDIISSAQKKLGFCYINTFDSMDIIHGDQLRRNTFRWPEDPFSHLNEDGYARYGAFIGEKLFRQNACGEIFEFGG